MIGTLTAYAIVGAIGVIVALAPMWLSRFGDDPATPDDPDREPPAN